MTKVLEEFRKSFDKFQQENFVIYGIGPLTKMILDNFKNYNIVGLMDPVRTGDIIYDKPVLSLDEVIKSKVKKIVIVARTYNIHMIYRRIQEQCKQNSIQVYDMNGNILSVENNNNLKDNIFISYKNILLEKINQVDVVSFDIFDTLIMRRVLYPRDVFEIMEKSIGDNFAKRRIAVESKLYQENKKYNIYDIYKELNLGSVEDELELESKLLIVRKEIYEVMRYAKEKHKQVYLVSDMYLTKQNILYILEKLSIKISPENLIISSEYGISKQDGLFNILKENVGNKRILHIGDNEISDISSAIKYGINDTFQIKSALGMLEESCINEMLKYDTTLENRMIIGEFISKELNNPFLFEDTKGKLLINNYKQYGYSYIAPLMYGVFSWINEKARELNLERIILSARDGYILNKIYNLNRFKNLDLVKMDYFYISRQAVVAASMSTIDDIIEVLEHPFSGTVEELLKKRFSIPADKIIPINTKLTDYEYVLMHTDIILKQSKILRENYTKYIQKFKFDKNMKIGFFDHIAAGTCQYAFQKITDLNLYGLYIIKTKGKYDKLPYIDFWNLKEVDLYNCNNVISSNTTFLETIITSNEPTVESFSEEGKVVFTDEYRNCTHIAQLNETHDGIWEYIESSQLSLFEINKVSKELLEMIIKVTNKLYSINLIQEEEFEVQDRFTNKSSRVIGINLAD